METFVLIMRTQPPTINHLALIKKIVNSEQFDKEKDELVIITGSANHKRERRNPFSWQERHEMLSAILKNNFPDIKYRLEKIDDYENYMDWVDQVKKIVKRNKATICGNEDVDFYARLLGYSPMLIPLKSNIHATQVRGDLANGKIPSSVPKEVADWLKKHNGCEIIRKINK